VAVDLTHLLFQQTANTCPQVALWTQTCQTLTEFSPTTPTSLPFQGPPVMPMDSTTGYICLPVVCLPAASTTVQPSSSTIQNQFCASLLSWQCILFGSLQKAGSTNALLGYLCAYQQLTLVSNASMQKNGRSSFSWIIAHHHTMFWCSSSLAPHL